jgi:uncharacterized membrane protein YeiH
MDPLMQSDTFWLNVTNIALGVVTLVCLLAVAGEVVRELLVRHRASAALREDDHLFAVPGLGLTMADGGKRVDRNKKTPFWRRWLR